MAADSTIYNEFTGIIAFPSSIPFATGWPILANNDSAWTHEFEDLSACALIDRTMARNPDKHLTSRLRAPPDFTGLWVHKIKDEAMFRRCHDPGQWCEGEESVVLATPAQFDDSRCYA